MKHTQRHWLAVATLALALPNFSLADITDKTLTIPIGSSVNMETGAVVTSGGDLKWDGLSLTPQGGAKAVYVGPGDATYQSLTQQILQTTDAPLVNTLPIPVGPLTGGSVLAVLTTAGHWAKLEVTTTSTPLNIPLPIKFTTFGAGGGGPAAPTITKIQNNSSSIPAGFPNSGIAPSSLFKIRGSGFGDPADLNNHPSDNGLSTTLNGASVKVTVGSTTVTPVLYYAGPSFDPDGSSPMQLSAVLPAATPLGTATVVVTSNGVPSNAFQIQIVEAAPGISTYQNGVAVAQDVNRLGDPLQGLVTFTHSIAPGGIIFLWGTGLGASSKDFDTTYNPTQLQTSIPYAIYIGGVQVSNIAYKGTGLYPGVSLFGLTVPSNVPTGCYVPVVAVATTAAGPVVSNTATLSIAAGGGACSDPGLGYDGNQLSSLNGQGTVKSGFLNVSQATIPGQGTVAAGVAIFQKSSTVTAASGGSVSTGGCVVTPTITGAAPTTTALNAGTITVTPPGGTAVTLSSLPQLPGFYVGTLPSIPSSGGAFVFNSTPGTDVGGFTATVNFPNPLLTWTNQAAAANVTRSQGLTVTWTGGASNSGVLISGTSTSGTATGSYTCIAPQSAGTFTVPSYILLSLPAANNGNTQVANSTALTPFSAAGLDFGATVGSVAVQVNSNYN